MLARIYRVLFAYLELYESRFEAVIAPLELVLIGVGFDSTLQRWRIERTLATTEQLYEICEMAVFVLLGLTVLSRMLIRRRKSKLGYGYRTTRSRVAQDDGNIGREQLRELVQETPIGFAPGLEPDWEDRVPLLAKLIADQASRKLSWRMWLGSDVRWATRERESLSAWFSDFPISLWQLPAQPDLNAPGAAGGNYFSIVVPMTRPSRRSIRKGHRATDMAEIPAVLRERFAGTRTSASLPMPERIDLLAYMHIHVPDKGSADSVDDSRLLMASVQHLAFLLHWLHGPRLQQKNLWNFTVLCESSNQELSAILVRLGFSPVEREHDGGEGHRYGARSYAGFTLFELVVEDGNCEGNPDGNDFLVALRDMAARLRQAGTPVAPAVAAAA